MSTFEIIFYAFIGGCGGAATFHVIRGFIGSFFTVQCIICGVNTKKTRGLELCDFCFRRYR